MYIEKYWGSYIGGTDDSLTLLDYLIDKQKTEVTFSEIFIDTGLKKLNGDFRTSPNLKYINTEGIEYNFYYAIDLIADLAALMLDVLLTVVFHWEDYLTMKLKTLFALLLPKKIKAS